MSKQPESRLQVKIRRTLEKECGGFWFKIWAGPFQKAGLPDIIGCCKGYFFAFEVKTLSGKPSKLQIHIIEQINQAGGCAKIVRTPEEAINYVTEKLNP